jgi:integrase
MKYNIKYTQEKRYKDGKLIIKDVPINAQITYNSLRIVYFTGFRVDYDKFSVEKQQVKKNAKGKQGKRDVYDNEINNVLTQIKSKLIDIFNNITTPPEKEFIINELDIVTKKIIKPDPINEVEKDLFYYFDIYFKNSKATPARLKSIKSYKKHLFEYSLHKNITLTFENCTIEILKDFENYLREDTPPKGDNTIKAIISLIRTFWNYSIANFDGINIPYPFKRSASDKGYTIPKEKYGEPIFLTIAERDLIFNANLDNNRLASVRDIFIFQCLIGARVGDLVNLTKDNIDKNNLLSYIPKKTKDKAQAVVARIPLTPKAIEILNKYNMPDNRILPFISDQKYNEYLKELFKFIGIKRKVEVLNSVTGQKEHISICDIASSHLARRTFVGNLVDKKAPLHIVTRMSGHVAGSKALARYYNVSDSTLKDYVNLID